MAAAALVSLTEYLNTTYRPDRDYIDGVLQERNVGERPHSFLQGVLFTIFLAHRNAWDVLPLTEQRVQISDRHFRVPDLCVVSRRDPIDAIVYAPPLLCIEILSREDTLREMQQRVDDYIAMGVHNIWIVDPILRIAYTATAGGFARPADGRLSVPETAISIALDDLFAQIDDYEAGR